MELLIQFLAQPSVQGLIGGMVAVLLKSLLIDWFTKGYFAQKRRELKSYEALYDSISLCEMRYSILWKSEIHDPGKGKVWTKTEQREQYNLLRTTIIEELIKIHHHFKWLDDKEWLTKLERWEQNIQARVEMHRKKIDEEPLSEEDKKSVDENPYKEILNLLKKKLHRMARYDY